MILRKKTIRALTFSLETINEIKQNVSGKTNKLFLRSSFFCIKRKYETMLTFILCTNCSVFGLD